MTRTAMSGSRTESVQLIVQLSMAVSSCDRNLVMLDYFSNFAGFLDLQRLYDA